MWATGRRMDWSSVSSRGGTLRWRAHSREHTQREELHLADVAQVDAVPRSWDTPRAKGRRVPGPSSTSECRIEPVSR